MPDFRQPGVYAESIPAKKTLRVTQADFSIGGALIESERMYDTPIKVSSIEEFALIFGDQVTSTQYGWDAIKGFFDNAQGVDASIIIQTLAGYDTVGDVIDAVVSSRDKADDGADADAYTIQPAYKGNLQYGLGGDRIGTKFTQVDRFQSLAAASVAATGVSSATLDSVAGMRVGDIVRFEATGGTPGTVYKKLTVVNESAKEITWSGDFESAPAAGESLNIDDVVAVKGFRVQVFKKSINGIVTEVETDLGKIICSSESDVTQYYVENVFADSNYVKITEASASTLGDRLPANDSDVTYGTGGADGTAVVTVESQDFWSAKMDDQEIRFLMNPETTDPNLQQALIDYCKQRRDTPIVIILLPEDRSKAQLITAGQNFQGGERIPAYIIGNWVKVIDPFATAVNAPYRNVPAVGHAMGAYIRSIGELGIHYVPATSLTLIRGIKGIVGDQVLDLNDRRDVMNAGVNVIQEKTGVGIKIANGVTPSTLIEAQFINQILMTNFVKISVENSLQSEENKPNAAKRIEKNRDAITLFMYNLWFKGSTGKVGEGETFGQTINPDKTLTSPDDHFEVIADAANNPVSSIEAGNQNIEVYLTTPAPAQSIRIGVGILLRG